MKTSQVETLRLKVEFYRRTLRRTVGGEVSAIYQRELTAAEFEQPNWSGVPTRSGNSGAVTLGDLAGWA